MKKLKRILILLLIFSILELCKTDGPLLTTIGSVECNWDRSKAYNVRDGDGGANGVVTLDLCIKMCEEKTNCKFAHYNLQATTCYLFSDCVYYTKGSCGDWTVSAMVD